MLLPMSSTVFKSVFKIALMIFYAGWAAASLRWTLIKQKLCLLVPHLILAWFTVSVQIAVEIVFLSKCLLNISEFISIGRCRCDSIIIPSVAYRSWNFDEPHQSVRISPKMLPHDLSRRWPFLAFRLDYRNSIFAGLPADQIARLQRIQNSAASLWWRKNFTDYPWNSAAGIGTRLRPTAISTGLYLRIFLHPHALTNHLAFSDLISLWLTGLKAPTN